MNQRELEQYITSLNPEADVIIVTTCGAHVNVLPLYEYQGTDAALEELAIRHALFVANASYYGGEANATTIDLRGRQPLHPPTTEQATEI